MRGTFYTSREFQIPKGALKISDKLSDAVAYLYPVCGGRWNGQPALLVFYGAQSKPVARFRYRNEAEREASVKKYFAGRQQHAARKVEQKAERTAAVATVKFEVGKTYHTRSAVDYDCIYSFEIVGRTAKMLTIVEHGKTYRRGVYVWEGVEGCKPHGTYSMCAIISADRAEP